jgi:protein tyrosine phosphatase (PTP) superfamily phosphohydrolase (DUF442 family)
MRLRALLLWAAAAGWIGCSAVGPADEAAPGPVDVPGIEHLMRVSDRLLCGGKPHAPEGFDTLRRLGVRLLVSVDGETPDVAAARAAGLRYVHIPIGYDGVPEPARLAILRVLREEPGRIYFHCHHGRHRGPAAAAIAKRIVEQCPASAARELLRRAETSPDYAGLWRDVEGFTPPPPGTPLPELHEVAPVGSMVSAMVDIDAAADRLKRLRRNGWKAPADSTDLSAATEAIVLSERFRETGRLLCEGRPAEFRRQMKESEAAAGELAAALRAGRPADADAAFSRLQKLCTQCHRAFRN